jgi:hypothetical protein
MGIGSIALGAIAWLLVLLANTLESPHELASLAIVLAISGWAVAHEGLRVEAGTSVFQKRAGTWICLPALVGAAASIAVDILRHRHRV